MQRLMARTATRNQTDLARFRCVAAVDDAVGVVDADVGPGGLDAQQRLGDNVLRVVDELFHSRDPSVVEPRALQPQARRPRGPLLLDATVLPNAEGDDPRQDEQQHNRIADVSQVEMSDYRQWPGSDAGL